MITDPALLRIRVIYVICFFIIAHYCMDQGIHGACKYIFSQLALPDDQDIPSHAQQLVVIRPVSYYVSVNFIVPEFHIAFRPYKISATFMSMPKTTVDEYYGFVFWQNDIRLSRQFAVVLSVPEAARKQILPDQFFRFGIFSVDP